VEFEALLSQSLVHADAGMEKLFGGSSNTTEENSVSCKTKGKKL
jgi:hypothetical protein